MPLIPARGKVRGKDCKLQASLGYTVWSCFKTFSSHGNFFPASKPISAPFSTETNSTSTSLGLVLSVLDKTNMHFFASFLPLLCLVCVCLCIVSVCVCLCVCIFFLKHHDFEIQLCCEPGNCSFLLLRSSPSITREYCTSPILLLMDT